MQSTFLDFGSVQLLLLFVFIMLFNNILMIINHFHKIIKQYDKNMKMGYQQLEKAFNVVLIV